MHEYTYGWLGKVKFRRISQSSATEESSHNGKTGLKRADEVAPLDV